jgi:hypothetical protein
MWRQRSVAVVVAAEDVADVDVAAGAVRGVGGDAAAGALGELADADLRAVGEALAVGLEGLDEQVTVVWVP